MIGLILSGLATLFALLFVAILIAGISTGLHYRKAVREKDQRIRHAFLLEMGRRREKELQKLFRETKWK